MPVVNALISAVLQVVVFTATPFVVYLITHRQAKGFFEYIGLSGAERRAMRYATLVVVVFVLPVLALIYFLPDLRATVTGPNTVIGKLQTYDSASLVIALIALKAFVQTSLSEEILFRGFIGKRLISWLGFEWGNFLQAAIFGLVHLLLFLGQPFSLGLASGIVLFTGLGGWVSGYLNEQVDDGSILPSWWMHGLTNAVTYTVLALT